MPESTLPGLPSRVRWLLAFLDAAGGAHQVDQLRITKGLFLLGQDPDWSGDPGYYVFEPYNYGPFDAAVYRDLAAMRIAGLVEEQAAAPGSARRLYRLTDAGLREAATVWKTIPIESAHALRRIKLQVTSQDFTTLLKDVYERFPEYAVNSIAAQNLHSSRSAAAS